MHQLSGQPGGSRQLSSPTSALPTTLASLDFSFSPLSCHPSSDRPRVPASQVKETRKIWGQDDVSITGTCIRVPVMRAHAESINLEFENDISGACAVCAFVCFVGVCVCHCLVRPACLCSVGPGSR